MARGERETALLPFFTHLHTFTFSRIRWQTRYGKKRGGRGGSHLKRKKGGGRKEEEKVTGEPAAFFTFSHSFYIF